MASVLVTGNNSGIGFATAITLGRAGHRVYATARSRERAAELAKAIETEQLPVTIVQMDVASDESVKSAFEEILRDSDRIDVLVNNAGVERVGTIEELPIDEFRLVMETNYFGALRCIRAVVPQMRERRSGCILNISSVAGRVAASPLTPYCASKFALEALTEALAQEMKPFDVRVGIVEPDIIDTPMADRIADPTDSKYPHVDKIPSLFRAALASPISPLVVANKVREIIEGDTWQFRHPVGASAEPLLAWRAGMTDEAWVELFALDKDSWNRRLQRDFGLSTTPAA